VIPRLPSSNNLFPLTVKWRQQSDYAEQTQNSPEGYPPKRHPTFPMWLVTQPLERKRRPIHGKLEADSDAYQFPVERFPITPKDQTLNPDLVDLRALLQFEI
jgi:hypothetical protein